MKKVMNSYKSNRQLVTLYPYQIIVKKVVIIVVILKFFMLIKSSHSIILKNYCMVQDHLSCLSQKDGPHNK